MSIRTIGPYCQFGLSDLIVNLDYRTFRLLNLRPSSCNPSSTRLVFKLFKVFCNEPVLQNPWSTTHYVYIATWRCKGNTPHFLYLQFLPSISISLKVFSLFIAQFNLFISTTGLHLLIDLSINLFLVFCLRQTTIWVTVPFLHFTVSLPYLSLILIVMIAWKWEKIFVVTVA